MPPARSTRCTGFRRRSRRSARCSKTSTARWPSRTRPPATCPTTPPPHRISSSRSATAPPKSTARPRRPRRMAKNVAKAGRAVTMFAQKLKIALRGAAAPGRTRGPAQERTAALQSQDRNPDRARPDRGIGLRDFHGRHPDLRTGRRAAAAQRDRQCHAGEHRRLQDPPRRALDGRRAGAVRGAGRRA